MSNIATETQTPAADPQPSEPQTKSKKAANGVKPAAKKVKLAKKPKPAAKKNSEKPGAERSNKKADVIAMMRRAKGATLAEIMELTAG